MFGMTNKQSTAKRALDHLTTFLVLKDVGFSDLDEQDCKEVVTSLEKLKEEYESSDTEYKVLDLLLKDLK